MSVKLSSFMITCNSPSIKKQCKRTKSHKMPFQFKKGTAFQKNRSQYFHHVTQGAYPADDLCPARHAADRRIQSTQKNECYHEEKHHEHGLLNGCSIIGDHQSET